MSRFIVTADAMGVPTAQVPLPLVRDLTRFVPAEKVVVAYHPENNHVLVNFPGLDTKTVQQILDDLSATTAGTGQDFTTWPCLHSEDGPKNRSFEIDSIAGDRIDLPDSPSSSILAELRVLMGGLTGLQQTRLSMLVCDLMTTLAAERLCFRKLFEAAPDGYVATDFSGTIQHANEAMYKLLNVNSPHLEGKSILMFFHPHSKALIQQRLRLLRTGISESQPFTDIQTQISLCDENKVSVSMRLIAIKSQDAALSTIRWLIRDMT